VDRTIREMPDGGAERALTAPVVGVTVVNFLFFVAYLFFFPTLPIFIRELGGAESEIGLLIGISSLAALGVRPVVGYLVDARGRKPVLLGGLGLFVVNALLYNVVALPEHLFPLRLLTGACLATVLTAASTLAADVAPPSRRGAVMSYFGLSNSLAFAVGPALGGWIIHAELFSGAEGWVVERAGWLASAKTGGLHFTSLFVVAAAIGAAAVALGSTLPETRPAGSAARRSLDPRTMVSSVALFPAGVNFLTAFVFAAMVTFMPLYARDHGVANPGSLFVAYAAAVVAMRIVIGAWMDRWPRAVVILPSILVLAGSMPILASAASPLPLYAAATVYGLGAGVFQPAMMAFLVDRAGVTERGRAMSTFTLGTDLGLSLGSFSLGAAVELAGMRAAFLMAGFAALAGAGLFAVGTGLSAARRMRGPETLPFT